MPDVFISYSRKDIEFAHKLDKALKDNNRDVWVDWEDIPAVADWFAEIQTGIVNSNNIICIISPDSIASKEVGRELELAAMNNKRLIPVVWRNVEPYNVPNELAILNWIFFRDTDDFDKAFKLLLAALDTDLKWVNDHTHLQVQALEWANKQRDASLLLRGSALREAEGLVAQSKEPEPTALQRQYTLASRKAAIIRQRITIGGVFAALIISMALAVVAIIQANVANQNYKDAVDARNQVEQQRQKAVAAQQLAEDQRKIADEQRIEADNQRKIADEKRIEALNQRRIALSSQLAAQSNRLLNSQKDLAILLSIESRRLNDTQEARTSLRDNLDFSFHPEIYLRQHTDIVRGVAFSPDNKTFASAGFDGTIWLWDATTKKAINKIVVAENSAETVKVWSVAFSPDGKTLASGSSDNIVRLWDVASQKKIAELKGHTYQVVTVAFSPDGKTLASGSCAVRANEVCQKGGIILWNTATNTAIGTLGQDLTNFTGIVYSIAFSPDGDTLVSGDEGGALRLWDVTSRKQIGNPLFDLNRIIWSVAFSPDGKTIASGVDDGTIQLWHLETRKESTLFGHKFSVLSVAFSKDGLFLVSGSTDQTVLMWDVSKEAIIGQPLFGHTDFVTGVTFSDNGDKLVTVGVDKNVLLWDTSVSPLTNNSPFRQDGPVRGVAFTGDNKFLITGGNDKTVRFWDIGGKVQVGAPLTGPASEVVTLAISPDGKTLAAGSCGKPGDNNSCGQGEIFLWDVVTRSKIGQSLTYHKNVVRSLVFSPDSKILASGSDDGQIIFYDLSAQKSVGQPINASKGIVFSVAFSPDGKTLASGGQDGLIYEWDVATQKQKGVAMDGHSQNFVFSVVYSPDGKTLASGGRDFRVQLWDVATQKLVGNPLKGGHHTAPVTSLAFSNDGKLLASGSSDKTIILWDVERRLALGQPFDYHRDFIRSVAFSNDGRFLASGSNDGSAVIKDIKGDTQVAQACQIVNRNLTEEEWKNYLPGEPFQKTCANLP